MAQIISLANQKGGCGKTTTAVNLAAAIAMQEKPTLLVDLDPQANATDSLGFDPEQVEWSTKYVLTDDMNIEDILLPTEIPTLNLAPADIILADAELELINKLSRETRLRRALAKVQESFHYIIIDCPPSLGLLTVNALTASDYVLIPVQTQYFSLKGLSRLSQTIEDVKVELNPNLAVLGMVATMYDQRRRIDKDVLATLESLDNSEVLAIFSTDTKLIESSSAGRSIFTFSKSSRSARAFIKLAREVIERHG